MWIKVSQVYLASAILQPFWALDFWTNFECRTLRAHIMQRNWAFVPAFQITAPSHPPAHGILPFNHRTFQSHSDVQGAPWHQAALHLHCKPIHVSVRWPEQMMMPDFLSRWGRADRAGRQVDCRVAKMTEIWDLHSGLKQSVTCQFLKPTAFLFRLNSFIVQNDSGPDRRQSGKGTFREVCCKLLWSRDVVGEGRVQARGTPEAQRSGS